jgi:tetratricopeptide (TPR) repeat protein
VGGLHVSARVVAAAAFALVVGGAGLARSQPPADATFAPAPPVDEEVARARNARERFSRGLEHYEAERFRDAIAEFESAARLVPSADVWFNIGRAHERLGEPGLAAESYRRYLRDRVDAPDAETVQARIAALEAAAEAQRRAALAPSAGTLVVRADRDGARVRLDGEATATTPVTAPLAVTPDRHRLDVSDTGRIPFRADVQVEAGVTTEARATLVPMTEYRTVGRRRVATWTLAAVAVASLGASVGLGVRASQLQNDGDLSGARDWARFSDYATAGVITLGLAATVAFFLEGRATRTERVRADADE